MNSEILDLIAEGEKQRSGLHKGESLQHHLNYLCQRHGLPTVLEILGDLAGEQASLAKGNQNAKKAWLKLHDSLIESSDLACQIEQHGGEIRD